MRLILYLPAFFLMIVACSSTEYASLGMEESNLPQGLTVGSQVTLDPLTDQLGREVVIPEEGYTVVFFYRGSWCPYCSRQMKNLSDSIPLITDKGAQIVAITPQAENEEFMEMSEYVDNQISIISDLDGSLMRYFDVDFLVTEGYQRKVSMVLQTDLAETNEQEEVTLPVPATYVIDSNGTIVWRFFDENYRVRASVAQILEQL